MAVQRGRRSRWRHCDARRQRCGVLGVISLYQQAYAHGELLAAYDLFYHSVQLHIGPHHFSNQRGLHRCFVFLEVVFKFGGPSSDLHEHRVQFHVDRAAVAANEIESRLDVGYWHLGSLPAKDLGDLFVDLVASTWLVGDWRAALEEVGQVVEGVAEGCSSRNGALIL